MEVTQSKPPEQGACAAMATVPALEGLATLKTHLKTYWVVCLTGLFNSKKDAASYV